MMRILLVVAIGVLVAVFMMPSAMPPASAAIYQQGIFYVIYDEMGDAAIENAEDVNSNGVPDMVEDVATQLNAAREVFKDVFNYPDPLESPRFQGIKSIEIDIRDKEQITASASAFSNIRKKSKHNPAERALHIRIANTLNPHKSQAPTHEYFHLIQFGTTYFNNGWFSEGTAQWAQDAVSKIENYPDGENFSRNFEDEKAKEELFQTKYKAAKLFWYPLAVNMNDKIKIPDEIIEKYKYVDGSPVFQDDIIYGANVVREVLMTMKSKEDLAAAEFGDVKEWRKKGRRAETNNEIILDCVREVYNAKK